VAFSPDGQKVAASITVEQKWNAIISIRHGTTLRQERQLEYKWPQKDHPGLPAEAETAPNRTGSWEEYVSALAFSPDGKLLAAAVRFSFHWKWWQGGQHPKVLQREENTVHRVTPPLAYRHRDGLAGRACSCLLRMPNRFGG
jgi:hypothetical protein